MRVLDYSAPNAPIAALPPGTAAVLGAFDGMHLGHQALVRAARARAGAVALSTFEPRPADVLVPERAPPRLQSPAQRARVCADLGLDFLVTLPFDTEIARLDPHAFVERFLIAGLAPARVVVGYDFHFGAGRAGGPKELVALLGRHGIEVEVVAQVSIGEGDDDKVGSTHIRELVGRGEVEGAAELLGRWFAVEGIARHGAGRGRGLGFPTANLDSHNMRPGPGVYACFLTRLADARSWPAVANIGTNPTFADGAATTTGLEVHAFDIELDDLHGLELEVAFVARLRDEAKFGGAEALREAITRDIEQARVVLSGAEARLHARRLVALEAGAR